jgi:fumarate reductase subunit C
MHKCDILPLYSIQTATPKSFMPTNPSSEKKPPRAPGKLRPTSTLPAGYKQRAAFAINFRNIRQLVIWNLVAGAVFVLVGWAIIAVSLYLRPEFGEGIVSFASQPVIVIIANILALIISVALHEMVHGLLFWAYTRTPPVFGIDLTHAYAAAPGWYLPRGQFLVVTLAPLIFLTLIGFIGIAFVPPLLSLPLIFAITANVAGAVGDVAVAVWLIFKSHRILIEDIGQSIYVYAP